MFKTLFGPYGKPSGPFLCLHETVLVLRFPRCRWVTSNNPATLFPLGIGSHSATKTIIDFFQLANITVNLKIMLAKVN